MKISRDWEDALLFIPELKAQATWSTQALHQGCDHACIEKEAGFVKGRSGTAQERVGGDTSLKLQVAVEIRRCLRREGNLSSRLIYSRQLVAVLVHNAYHITCRGFECSTPSCGEGDCSAG